MTKEHGQETYPKGMTGKSRINDVLDDVYAPLWQPHVFATPSLDAPPPLYRKRAQRALVNMIYFLQARQHERATVNRKAILASKPYAREEPARSEYERVQCLGALAYAGEACSLGAFEWVWRLCDGALAVIREKETRRRELSLPPHSMSQQKIRLLGVLADAKRQLPTSRESEADEVLPVDVMCRWAIDLTMRLHRHRGMIPPEDRKDILEDFAWSMIHVIACSLRYAPRFLVELRDVYQTVFGVHLPAMVDDYRQENPWWASHMYWWYVLGYLRAERRLDDDSVSFIFGKLFETIPALKNEEYPIESYVYQLKREQQNLRHQFRHRLRLVSG